MVEEQAAGPAPLFHGHREDGVRAARLPVDVGRSRVLGRVPHLQQAQHLVQPFYFCLLHTTEHCNSKQSCGCAQGCRYSAPPGAITLPTQTSFSTLSRTKHSNLLQGKDGGRRPGSTIRDR